MSQDSPKGSSVPPPPPPPPDVHLPVSGGPPPAPEGSGFARAHHLLLAFCGLALVVWLLSGVYMINTNEVGVIERLGRYETISGGEDGGKILPISAGLHYHLPWPIDRVYKIPIQKSSILEVKTFNEPMDAYRDFKLQMQRQYNASTEVLNALFDPYLITGDKDLVHMQIALTYRLDDPDAWLNTVAHDSSLNPGVVGMREELFQHLVERAMIGVVGKVPIDKILFEGRDQLTPLLQTAIVQELQLPDPRDPTGHRKTDMGIRLDRVDVGAAHAPQAVQPAFDRVFQATSDEQSAIVAGQIAAQNAIIEAKASKDVQIRQAEAYRAQTVAAAQGEAARFAQIYEQYKIAPDITRWNVYVEAVGAVSGKADRIMFAQPGQHTWLTIEPPKFDAAQVAPK